MCKEFSEQETVGPECVKSSVFKEFLEVLVCPVYPTVVAMASWAPGLLLLVFAWNGQGMFGYCTFLLVNTNTVLMFRIVCLSHSLFRF